MHKLHKNHAMFRNVMQVFFKVSIPFSLALCCSMLRQVMDVT